MGKREKGRGGGGANVQHEVCVYEVIERLEEDG